MARDLSYEEAHENFEYRDGHLCYKKDHHRKNKKGSQVGNPNDCGYILFAFNKVNYRVHRVIFLMHHGFAPEMVDHIDRNPGNNRIENLRAATERQNHYNQKRRANNKSGYRGVSRSSSASKKFLAHIGYDGKQHHLGSYIRKTDAAMAYDREAMKVFGEFANLNFKYDENGKRIRE